MLFFFLFSIKLMISVSMGTMDKRKKEEQRWSETKTESVMDESNTVR